MKAHERIIVAVDADSYESAAGLLESLDAQVGAIKLGLEFACAEGWAKARQLGEEFGLPVFMDAKLKDIPNTLAGATRALMTHRPAMFTVMADNSLLALEAVVAVRNDSESDSMIIGVTVLTSIDAATCQSIYGGMPAQKVGQFAENAKAAGFDAIVCSPRETAIVKQIGGVQIINPGVRPLWAVANDQARPTTPGEAVENGADRLVIGRPITQPPPEIGSPKAALQRIIEEVEEALA